MRLVARVLVEDGEEGLVGKRTDFGGERRDVVHVVGGREVVFWDDGASGGVGKGTGPVGVEGGVAVRSFQSEVLGK